MMGFGFELQESFSGSYYRLDDPLRDHAMRFSLRLGVSGLRRFFKERKVAAVGTVFAERLAERAPEGVPLEGSLTIKLFDERRIPYDLSFEGDDGRRYRLRGQRDFFVHDAIDSLTMLPASLYDQTSDHAGSDGAGDPGIEMGRAILRFDPKTQLPALMRSFRPRMSLARLPG